MIQRNPYDPEPELLALFDRHNVVTVYEALSVYRGTPRQCYRCLLGLARRGVIRSRHPWPSPWRPQWSDRIRRQ